MQKLKTNKFFFFTIVFSFIALIGCNSEPKVHEPVDTSLSIKGLWLVKEVQVGKQILTPQGKWMKFNADSTQTSGNGWSQHSIGSWSMNEKNSLSIVNTNGWEDPYGAFRIELGFNEMEWMRVEEGDTVVVKLKRIAEVPAISKDKLLGVWKLSESKGNSEFLQKLAPEDSSDYLFFRMDQQVEVGSEGEKEFGVFQVHAHRNLLRLLPYNEEQSRETYSFEVSDNELNIFQGKEERTFSWKFKRTRKFPN